MAAFVAAIAQPSRRAVQARALDLSRDERAAIAALQAAASGVDRAAQDSALAAARAVARSADARYALAHYQLEIARARGDQQMQTQAVDALVESGLAGPDELPALLAHQATRAYSAGDVNRADRLLARAVELQPNNAALLADAGQLRARIAAAYASARRTAEAQTAMQQAVGLLRRAIEVRQAAGQPAPESWHLRALALAADGRMAPQAIALARGLVAAYPTPLNWRDALLSYRELAPADPTLDLDVRRLMRASQALAGERDYLELCPGGRRRPGCTARPRRCSTKASSRGMLEPAKPAVAAAIAAANRRAAAGPRRPRPAAHPGARPPRRAAGARRRRRSFRPRPICRGGRTLPGGAAEGRRGRQSGQQPARRRARARPPPAGGRGRAPRGDRPARRSRRLLAGLARPARRLTGFQSRRRAAHRR